MAIRKRLITNPSNSGLASNAVACFQPEWDHITHAYTAKFIRKNIWRLARTCDEQDAMQEARIVFLRCQRKYSGKVDNAAWFMGLYKQSLAARFNDLATVDTRQRSAILLSDLGDNADDVMPEAPGELRNEGELLVMLNQAPTEVRQVLSILLSAPTELLELVSLSWQAKGKKKSLGSPNLLCQLLGLPPGEDPLRTVREYFG